MQKITHINLEDATIGVMLKYAEPYSQIIKLNEEIAELNQLLLKKMNYLEISDERVREEAADVEIMAKQVCFIFNYSKKFDHVAKWNRYIHLMRIDLQDKEDELIIKMAESKKDVIYWRIFRLTSKINLLISTPDMFYNENYESISERFSRLMSELFFFLNVLMQWIGNWDKEKYDKLKKLELKIFQKEMEKK